MLGEPGPDVALLDAHLAHLIDCGDHELAFALRAHRAALTTSLQSLPRWAARLERETDRRLALDLRDAVGRFVAARRSTFGGTLRFVPPAIPFYVRFPRGDLEPVLDVLLDNAGAAGAKNVGMEIVHGRRGRMALIVADDGPGIPAELREEVFRPDYSTGGGGFGLAHAREVLQRMGATIDLEPGDAGARFRLELEALEPPVEGARQA